MLRHDPMIVTDAATDPRTCDHALVRGAPQIRFYTGIPLRTGAGQLHPDLEDGRAPESGVGCATTDFADEPSKLRSGNPEG